MFIAMNRFRIAPGHEEEFEAIWAARDSHLKGEPGFIEFHLLKGPSEDDHTLYASHTVWASREAFDDWIKSDAFRAAHKGAGDRGHLYLGPPKFEGFEAVQQVK